MKFSKVKVRSLIATSVLVLTISGVYSSVAWAAPTFVNLQILMEGPASGSTTGMMRTDLWDLDLLDTVTNTQDPQYPCRDNVAEQIDLNGIPSAQTTPVDWVCVELRDATNPETVRSKFIGIVQANGLIRRSDGSIPIIPLSHSNQYYVVVTNRSHLPVASELTPITNGKLEVIFRAEPTGPFAGAHQTSIGGAWAMLAGNPDQQDSTEIRAINGSDILNWSQNDSMLSQYLSADVNLDGNVDAVDRALITNNNGLFTYIPFAP